MVGDFRASLYDLFGFLLPGIVAAAGLGLLCHALFAAGAPIFLDSLGSPLLGWTALLASYFLGHLCHAVGNLFPVHPEDELLKPGGKRSLALLTAIDARLKERYGAEAPGLKPIEKFGILDEEGMFAGERGDRDVYIYREGFYRGMVVSSALLALGILPHMWLGPTEFIVGGLAGYLSRSEFTGALILSAAYAVASAARMRRFGRYRVERAAFRWLAAISSESKTDRGPATS